MSLGIESQNEFLSLELAVAAHKLVTEVIPMKPAQEVVITADTASDWRVVEATAQAAYVIGAQPIIIRYNTRSSPCMEPPSAVAAALTVADIWIEYASAYILYSKAYQTAIDAGCKYLCLPGMNVDMMVRTIGQVNHRLLGTMKMRLHQLSQQAESIHITSNKGTDVSVKVNPAISPFDKPPDATKGYAQMLAGQAGFNTFSDTFEGTLVLDGTVWPPEELGILCSPIRIMVEKGKIVEIYGDYEAWLFRSWLESFSNPSMPKLDHICYGFNPGVKRLTGRILEDERLFGCVEFGIGRVHEGAPSHSDGIILSPSVWVDGIQLESEGIYVDPEIKELCHQMRIPGYCRTSATKR